MFKNINGEDMLVASRTYSIFWTLGASASAFGVSCSLYVDLSRSWKPEGTAVAVGVRFSSAVKVPAPDIWTSTSSAPVSWRLC